MGKRKPAARRCSMCGLPGHDRRSHGAGRRPVRSNLDAFVDDQGRIHPIRSSSGYDDGKRGGSATGGTTASFGGTGASAAKRKASGLSKMRKLRASKPPRSRVSPAKSRAKIRTLRTSTKAAAKASSSSLGISVREVGGALVVKSPYHPNWPEPAKKLGGRWSPTDGAWKFDSRERAEVKALLQRIYGTAGEPIKVVTVEMRPNEVGAAFAGDSYTALGRVIVQRPGRDMKVRYGDGVVVLSGGFPSSAGSMRYPALGQPIPGTVLRIKDVPLAKAQKAGDGFKIV